MFDGIDEVCHGLENESALEIRWKMVNELGRRGGQQALKHLTFILENDESAVLREEAAKALCGYADAAAKESLINALKGEPLVEVRCAVIEGLGNFKDARVTDALVDVLREKDGRIQRSAALALGAIRDPRAIEPLVAALAKAANFVRDEIIKSLGAFGGLAFSPLLKALEVESRAGMRAVVAALSGCGSCRVGQLIEALDSPVASVREGVALALGPVGDVTAVGGLVAATHDESLGVVRAAVASLGYYDTEMAVGALLEASRHTDAGVRARSAKALCRTGSPRAVEPLIGLLEDESALVCHSAELSLGKMGALSVGPLVTKLGDKRRWVRRRVVRALSRTGEAAADLLVEALKDHDWRVRAGAARALGRLEVT